MTSLRKGGLRVRRKILYILRYLIDTQKTGGRSLRSGVLAGAGDRGRYYRRR